MAKTSGAGRPRRSSRRTLEDAAAELFLENTYEGTTVDAIASRAGVSRNTFFNYFAAKSDVLWVDFDETIRAFESVLAERDPIDGLAAVEGALESVAAEHPQDRVPWALTQVDLMGTREVLQQSGLTRFLRMSGLVERFLASGAPEQDPLIPQAAASAITAAATAAAARWASAGVSRGPLPAYVRAAVAPACTGYRDVL